MIGLVLQLFTECYKTFVDPWQTLGRNKLARFTLATILIYACRETDG